MKIRGKEMNLKSSDNYTVKLGTVNNKEPKCVYFEIKGWVAPTDKSELNYGQIVNRLTKRTKSKLFQTINKDRFHGEVFILDLDLRESGIQHGKKSYFNCEVCLFQENDIKSLPDLVPDIEKMTNSIITEVFEPFEYFTFHKKKK